MGKKIMCTFYDTVFISIGNCYNIGYLNLWDGDIQAINVSMVGYIIIDDIPL